MIDRVRWLPHFLESVINEELAKGEPGGSESMVEIEVLDRLSADTYKGRVHLELPVIYL